MFSFLGAVEGLYSSSALGTRETSGARKACLSVRGQWGGGTRLSVPGQEGGGTHLSVPGQDGGGTHLSVPGQGGGGTHLSVPGQGGGGTHLSVRKGGGQTFLSEMDFSLSQKIKLLTCSSLRSCR